MQLDAPHHTRLRANRDVQATVLVADAQPLFLDAAARAIDQSAALRLISRASDGREALERIRRHRPDVALIDLDLPRLAGRRVLNAVVRDALPTRIVVLTADVGPAATFGALSDGAIGYLSKAATAEEVREAVEAAAAGESRLDQRLQTVVLRELRLRHKEPATLLSPREREILSLIAGGLSGPQIARRLHLARATVKTHTEHLYGKLDVSERAQAVAEAMRRGLLE